jgi:hypothetical protein
MPGHAGVVEPDPVPFTSPASPDPCPTMTWEIAYSTSGGQRVVTDVQAAADLNVNGIPGYLDTNGGTDPGSGGGGTGGGGQTSSGCTCSAAGPDGLVAPMLLALLVLARLRPRCSR